MNRQFKFRGRSLINGKWVCGDSIKHTENATETGIGVMIYIGERVQNARKVGAMKWVPVDPATVGQFTGLLDRNGKEIYEGDILMLGKSINSLCVVGWNKEISAFCIRFHFESSMGLKPLGAWKDEVRDIKVIDNIHDNQEI